MNWILESMIGSGHTGAQAEVNKGATFHFTLS
jgi:hypothetical protein